MSFKASRPENVVGENLNAHLSLQTVRSLARHEPYAKRDTASPDQQPHEQQQQHGCELLGTVELEAGKRGHEWAILEPGQGELGVRQIFFCVRKAEDAHVAGIAAFTAPEPGQPP